MPPESHGARASTKQLAYLKALAQRTATTFTYPLNRVEASREIVDATVVNDDLDQAVADLAAIVDDARRRFAE